MSKPKIEWIERGGRSCLKFTFQDSFGATDAESGIAEWREALKTKPGERIVHIWDCLAMKDYEQQARSTWSEACKEFSGQIDRIWVVTNSLLIKMGATVISVFSSLNISVVSSEDDIKL